MVIGYVKSTSGSLKSCKKQKELILQYCNLQGLKSEEIFCDYRVEKRTQVKAKILQEEFGIIKSFKGEKCFPEWDKMLALIKAGKVQEIIVESVARIYTTKCQYEGLLQICEITRTKIIEVCNRELNMKKRNNETRVAIYHFTDSKMKRPVIMERELDKMYEFIMRQEDWKVTGVYMDYSLKKSNQIAYNQFRNNVELYDVLVTSDFYHIETKTGTFLSELKYLNSHNIAVESVIDGKIEVKDEETLFGCSLKVAVYHSKFCEAEERTIELQIEIFKNFIMHKTKWVLEDIYVDKCKKQRDGEQKELLRLISNCDKYNLVLVKGFSKFHWRTAMLAKRRMAMQLPIYSLQEGYID